MSPYYFTLNFNTFRAEIQIEVVRNSWLDGKYFDYVNYVKTVLRITLTPAWLKKQEKQ